MDKVSAGIRLLDITRHTLNWLVLYSLFFLLICWDLIFIEILSKYFIRYLYDNFYESNIGSTDKQKSIFFLCLYNIYFNSTI